MINDETRRKLDELNLTEMVDAIRHQENNSAFLGMSFEERMSFLVDYIYQEKYVKKVKRLVKMAKLRFPEASVDQVIYTDRCLDRNTILNLSNCQFINTNTNVVFEGFTGSGKTYLACAIGKAACQAGYRTKYIRLPDLLQLHDEADISVSGVSKLLKKFSGYSLLIIDEWLLDDLTRKQEHFLFELFERRYTDGSTVFCTQYRMEDWHDRLGGGIHGDAIVDRITSNSIRIYTGDLNMRRISK